MTHRRLVQVYAPRRVSNPSGSSAATVVLVGMYPPLPAGPECATTQARFQKEVGKMAGSFVPGGQGWIADFSFPLIQLQEQDFEMGENVLHPAMLSLEIRKKGDPGLMANWRSAVSMVLGAGCLESGDGDVANDQFGDGHSGTSLISATI